MVWRRRSGSHRAREAWSYSITSVSAARTVSTPVAPLAAFRAASRTWTAASRMSAVLRSAAILQ
ncbi:hypothetical protein QR97_37810 [Streptomyces sp. PBH53]|nr:hypothetical protein QR97_37810 [Streptomyces sp. PBH53]